MTKLNYFVMNGECMTASNYLNAAGKPVYAVNNKWFWAEKFDGQRAVWSNQQLLSRNANPITAPDWFIELLKHCPINLDGELYLGRQQFHLTGNFRSNTVNHALWHKVRYMVFDIYDPGGTCLFKDRLVRLQDALEHLSGAWRQMPQASQRSFPVELVDFQPVRSNAHIKEAFSTIVGAGGEGLILRNGWSPYICGRSKHMLKYKPVSDEEARIVGYKPGNGKFAGKLGAFMVESCTNPKIKYSVSGLTDYIRSTYQHSHPLGTVITVAFTEKTKSGKPRFPRYKGIRADLNWHREPSPEERRASSREEGAASRASSREEGAASRPASPEEEHDELSLLVQLGLRKPTPEVELPIPPKAPVLTPKVEKLPIPPTPTPITSGTVKLVLKANVFKRKLRLKK